MYTRTFETRFVRNVHLSCYEVEIYQIFFKDCLNDIHCDPQIIFFFLTHLLSQHHNLFFLLSFIFFIIPIIISVVLSCWFPILVLRVSSVSLIRPFLFLRVSNSASLTLFEQLSKNAGNEANGTKRAPREKRSGGMEGDGAAISLL